MKSSLLIVFAAALGVAGCSSAPPAGSSSPATPTPTPAATPAPGSKEAQAKGNKRAEELLGLRSPAEVKVQDDKTPNPVPFLDPETGRRVLEIPKGEPGSQYYERNGRLFLAMVKSPGVPILRQNDKAWIVEAPPEVKRRDPKALPEAEDLEPIFEVPKSEAEVVTPKLSRETFRFEEISAGLPRSGMWRENFDLGDVLGEGRPQIVAPPPRLTGLGLMVFSLGKDDKGSPRWSRVPIETGSAEHFDAEYGFAAVADIDGDGKPDIVYGGHGAGPVVAINKGGGKFSAEARNLPRQISTRAAAIGDLDGDGRPDLLVISDMGESGSVGGRPAPAKDGYSLGYDVRAFLNDGTTFHEVHAGLEHACFGYAIALVVPKDASGGLPFYNSACRYIGGAENLFEFDAKAAAFRFAGASVVEGFGQQAGAASGTYRGRPAIYASWFKRTPGNGRPKIDGEGVTIYYRGADGKMEAKRVVKTLKFDTASPAIAVGDLNGDGLDDFAWADESAHRIRVFFQTAAGEFEELAADREPAFVNHPTCMRIGDVDGDGRPDVVLMYQYLTGDETRAGGLRVFRGLGK